MAMVAAVIERACQQAEETYGFITSIQGTPTPDQMQELKERVWAQVQLTDAASAGVRYVAAELRLGPNAQQTRRLRSGWQDAQELEAVRERLQQRRIRRR